MSRAALPPFQPPALADLLPTLGPNPMQAVLEIFLLALGIYAILRFLRSTRGVGVLRGLAMFVLVALIGFTLLKETIQVPVLQEILSDITPYLVIVVVILFQPELRHGITRFGHTTFLRFFSRDPESDESLGKVVAAAQRMAKERVGALIAFERSVSLAPYYESAVQLEAPISAILLETIFFPGSPLHDGAVIVSGNTIRAAACLLPLTENQEVQRRMGTRHRAALGLTEEADAITLVVSEETGRISLCANGEMRSGVPFDQLEHELRDLLRSERRSRSGREADSETAEAVAQGGPSAEDGAGDETPAASAAPAGPRTETAGRADAPAPSGKEATAS